MPPRSLPKRFIDKASQISKRFLSPFKQLGSPDRSPSAPPNVPQRSGQHLGTGILHQSTQSLPVSPVPISHQSGITSESTTGTSAVASGALLVKVDTPALALGEAGPFSSAAQTSKVLAKGTLGLLSHAADGIPVPGVKGIFDIISKVIQISETTQANQDGFKALENRCQELLEITNPLKGKELSDIPQPLQDSIKKLENDLSKILIEAENKWQLGSINRILNHEEYAGIIQIMNEKIHQHVENYMANINTWSVITIHKGSQIQAKMFLEQHLPWAKAGFDHRSSESRSSCFPGTRKELLTDIDKWMWSTTKDEPIYILYGIAGIGKSTVAQTVAKNAASGNILLGSFFFSRHMDSCKTGDHFFATLAFQFACYHANLAAQIAQTLEDVPDILAKTLDVQCKQLIVEPIQKANIAQNPLILVIDALDECLASDARKILENLAKYIQHMPNVKIFITTRPESYIKQVVKLQGPLQAFYLHEIETSIAIGDIELFLKYALSKEQVKNTINRDWEPADRELELVVEKCGILFIMASTAVKYILDTDLNNPAAQICSLIKGIDIQEGEHGVLSSLDHMYLAILKSSVPKRERQKYLKSFNKVVGAIVILEDPLSMETLSKLLDIAESEIETTLQKLHSIMAPASSNQTPQLYHKSFPDFITDAKRCIDPEFYIVPQKHHAELAQLCFSLMETHLHQDMHGFQGAERYKTNAEMGDERTKYITKELKYACIYWISHLEKCDIIDSKKLLPYLEKFAFTHLLHWMEVLSLIGKLDIVYPALRNAMDVLTQWNAVSMLKVKEVLNDGSLCITKFYEVIKRSGSHVYYSALPWMPKESEIYRTYKDSIVGAAMVLNGNKHWDPLLASLEGHSDRVECIAFSPDGSRLASGSNDCTVKIWNGFTGDYISTLEGHSNWVTSVAFSSDGSRLASGSFDCTIKLWNGLTGDHIATLEGHSNWVTSVAFSSDGSRLASGSDDCTVKLWHGLTGDHIATLEGHSNWVTSVAFSSDGSRLASGSHDCTVKLWHGLTGDHIATLEGHSGSVTSVAFSFDGSGFPVFLVTKDLYGVTEHWDWSTITSILSARPYQTGHSDVISFSDSLIPVHGGAAHISEQSTKISHISLPYQYMVETHEILHVPSSTTVFCLPYEFQNAKVHGLYFHTLAMGYETGKFLIISLPTIPI